MMMHILVVDDEPLAVDYLVQALDEKPDFEHVITKAYSGKEALKKTVNQKVDLLLTDIQMPGMNGIELANKLLLIWSKCKVIFLSSYDDFEYIQSAIRIGSVDYVLKTEGDEVIFQAMKKAIDDIKRDFNTEKIMQKSKQQYKSVLPSLRSEYLRGLLEEEEKFDRKTKFKEFEINLDSEQEVFAILAKINNFGSFQTIANRTHLIFAIENIAADYLQKRVRFVSFLYEKNRILWLIQPLEREKIETAKQYLNDFALKIQEACRQWLHVPLSIAIMKEQENWHSLGSRIDSLKMQLNFYMGTDAETLIIETRNNEELSTVSSQTYVEMRNIRAKARKLDALETYLDNGKKDEVIQYFKEHLSINEKVFLDKTNKWFGLELFSHLSAYFLSYLNSRNLFVDNDFAINVEKLTNPEMYNGWKDMMDYFHELAIEIAEFNQEKQFEETNDIINKVHEYIHRFLHEELSLPKLAELVYLSPPYFSKIYKEKTGQGLLEYINEVRIDRAKELLRTTDKKVNKIASEIGIESASYFTRLFKMKTGISPQGFRNNISRMQ